MGIERLLIVMDKQNSEFLTPRVCDVYFATMGDKALEKAMKISHELREFGYHAEFDLMGRGIKAQMKYANKIGSAFTVVIGDNELENGSVKVKEMETGNEVEIALDDKFRANFESLYFNKMMNSLEDEELLNNFTNGESK